MIKLECVNVYNWINAIRGMRNSWESWDKSDSTEYYDFDTKNNSPLIGENDYALMIKLAKAGSEHAKYLRQILVSVDVTTNLKWFDEFDQYHFHTTNSTSAMHTLGRDFITPEAFSFEDVDDDLLDAYMHLLDVARIRWINAGKKKPSREWRQLIMLTAMGINYTRTVTTNYGQLRTMYQQRRLHRLQEWREFCNWIETLPYSELITGKVVK